MTPTEYSRTELKVPNDSRAIGAVRGALEHAARHLGFSAAEEGLLIAAADQLLRRALESMTPNADLFVGIQEWADRIEVEMIQPGGNAQDWAQGGSLTGIDEVEQKTGAGKAHLKLVKFLPGGSHPPQSQN